MFAMSDETIKEVCGGAFGVIGFCAFLWFMYKIIKED